MNVIYNSDFSKSAKQLPNSAKIKLAKLIESIRDDPFHPLLHTKRLSGKLKDLFVFRITRDYRVIFQFIDKETIQLIKVKHRKDIYQ